jgi:hypothetical protein
MTTNSDIAILESRKKRLIQELADTEQAIEDHLKHRDVEPFVRTARDLMLGMQERVGRLPDYADFRAAFKKLV